MPLIQVTMIEGRTAEQKRALLDAITQVVQDTVDAPLDSIRAWVVDVPAEQFMSAGTLTADRRRAAASPDAGAGVPPGPPIDPITAPGGAPLP
jgi:4-oxalocrotonate tautomerase